MTIFKLVIFMKHFWCLEQFDLQNQYRIQFFDPQLHQNLDIIPHSSKDLLFIPCFMLIFKKPILLIFPFHHLKNLHQIPLLFFTFLVIFLVLQSLKAFYFLTISLVEDSNLMMCLVILVLFSLSLVFALFTILSLIIVVKFLFQ